MGVLNRKQAPQIAQVEQLNLFPPDVVKLDNDVPVYVFDRGKQEVLKIQMYFSAGKIQEPQKLAAQMTATLMKEGTKNLSAKEIAEKVEYYGATFKIAAGSDYAALSLYLLTRQLGEVLPLVHDVLTNAILSEEEFAKKKSVLIQQLAVKKGKIEYLADRKFNAYAFGEKHPYGYIPAPEMYEALELDGLRAFAKNNYAAGCSIYIAGKLANDSLSLVNRWLGGKPFSPKPISTPFSKQKYSPVSVEEYIAKKDSMQAAVRLGGMSIGKNHPDYAMLSIVTTILGGYFGSRLMGNIRQDKNYTYGIYAMLVNFFGGNYFIISSEVGADKWQPAIREIFFEIDRLKNDPISGEELARHRSYMLGKLLSAMDGPFKTATSIRQLLMYGLDFSYVEQYMQTIKNVTPQQIRDITQKYLPQKGKHIEVVVGP